MMTRRVRLPGLLFLLGVILAPALVPAAADDDVRPIVVFREDDCSGSWRNHYAGLDGMSGVEYGKLKKIPITWAVIANETTENSINRLNWPELRDYLDKAGGETASHSCSHSSLPTDQAYIDELSSSKAIIEANMPGRACNTFLQPGPWAGAAYMDQFSKLNNSIGKAVQGNYVQSMAYLGGGWIVGEPYYRYGFTNAFSVDYLSFNGSADNVSATLDVVAASPGTIFVVDCHAVQETTGQEAYCVRADILKTLMNKLAELRDANKIRLMSLNDAMHTPFPKNINHIPDASFESCTPGTLNSVGPWTLSGGAVISTSQQATGLRSVDLPVSGARALSYQLMLPPGRYELSWSQKIDRVGPSEGRITAQVNAIGPGANPSTVPINAEYYSVFSSSDWQRQTALLLVEDMAPMGAVSFNYYSGGCVIDDVSLVLSPLDPAVSATKFKATPMPSRCMVEWDTPVRTDLKNVSVDFGRRSNPTAPKGPYAKSIAAVSGTHQSLILDSVNWQGTDAMYFSVFAVDTNDQCAPPDLAVVRVDKTAPSVPTATLHLNIDNHFALDFHSDDQESGIYDYSYAVGSKEGGSDIVGWTSSSGTAVLPFGKELRQAAYLSVKARNPFGFWSAALSQPITIPTDVSAILAQQNGALVEVDGNISAIFADCYYVQEQSRYVGIKVLGTTTAALGDYVSVIGTLTTGGGERLILPSH